MRRSLALCIAALGVLVSCGPSKHAVHVEMRHPSKTGVNLVGKNVAVVYLEGDNVVSSEFGESTGFPTLWNRTMVRPLR